MRKTGAEYQALKTTACWVTVAFTGRGSGVSSRVKGSDHT